MTQTIDYMLYFCEEIVVSWRSKIHGGMYSCHSCISELYDYDLICTLYLCHFVSIFFIHTPGSRYCRSPWSRGAVTAGAGGDLAPPPSPELPPPVPAAGGLPALRCLHPPGSATDHILDLAVKLNKYGWANAFCIEGQLRMFAHAHNTFLFVHVVRLCKF